jgi:hypothetical protein
MFTLSSQMFSFSATLFNPPFLAIIDLSNNGANQGGNQHEKDFRKNRRKNGRVWTVHTICYIVWQPQTNSSIRELVFLFF